MAIFHVKIAFISFFMEKKMKIIKEMKLERIKQLFYWFLIFLIFFMFLILKNKIKMNMILFIKLIYNIKLFLIYKISFLITKVTQRKFLQV